jgi:Na+/pantothenate symporter
MAVFLLCLLLGMMQNKSMKNTVLVRIAVGVIGYLTTTYTNSIWFDFNSFPYLVDAILAWLFCGLWLGYWLHKP